MRFLFLIVMMFACACQRVSTQIEPCIESPRHEKEVMREKRNFMLKIEPSPFSPLTIEERESDWGKEYEIGFCFAQDFDLYRAITSFKRALILLGESSPQRALELRYYITLSYYLGGKYIEVVYMAEAGAFATIDDSFVAYEDILLMLHDSYLHLGECDKAARVLSQIQLFSIESADKIVFFSEVKRADFSTLFAHREKEAGALLRCYCSQSKSVKKAQGLNMILPGAGYWYVGQKQTAVTAFLVNALFIGAAVNFFVHDHIAAGAIFLTLETGWYFGGITGAGLAAKSYNERLYEGYAHKICMKERLYPLLRLTYKF